MKKPKKNIENIINIIKINQQRNKVVELFEDYQAIVSFRNRFNRMKKNPYKKTIKGLLIVIFIFFTYAIGAIFFKKDTVMVVTGWIITLSITIYLKIKCEINSENLNKYQEEMTSSMDNEICKLLTEKGIDSTNIKVVIKYFTAKLEYVNSAHIVYKEFPVLSSVSKFGSNLVFLLLGIMIPGIIKEKIYQNKIQIYAMLIVGIIGIAVFIVAINIYAYMNRKNTYLDRERQLVIDLKRIDLLNKLDLIDNPKSCRGLRERKMKRSMA